MAWASAEIPPGRVPRRPHLECAEQSLILDIERLVGYGGAKGPDILTIFLVYKRRCGFY